MFSLPPSLPLFSLLSLPLTLCHPQKNDLIQTLNVSSSCLDSDSTGACQTIRTALNTTCRLYEANRILPNISLPDQTAQQVLQLMSNKSVQDACSWMNANLPAGFPSNSGIDCSIVSSLGGVCSQWREYVSIVVIESKVDRLGPTPISETSWRKRHCSLGRSELC